MTEQTVQATGNITLDDVRNAIGETDANSTNAGKLREILGRGSMATIQKFLQLIRVERAPVIPGAQAPAPSAPKDVIDALWATAWSAASAMTYGRMETLSAQRDAANLLSETQALDIVELTSQVDALADKLAMAAGTANAAAAKAESDLAATVKKVEEVTKALDVMTAAKNHVEATAAHAAQLATRDAQIAASAMQSTIDRLNDQIGELKSLLIVRTTTAPVANLAVTPAAT